MRSVGPVLLVIGLLGALAFGWLIAVGTPTHHRYSDVPGQDHPYCPPDPKDCD